MWCSTGLTGWSGEWADDLHFQIGDLRGYANLQSQFCILRSAIKRPMTDALDRLKAALSDRYTIEREIG